MKKYLKCVCQIDPPPRNGQGEEPLANTNFWYLSVFSIQEMMKFGVDLDISNLIHNYISNITQTNYVVYKEGSSTLPPIC